MVVDVDDEVDVVDDGVVVGVVLVEDALVLVVGVLEVGVSEEEEEVAVSVGVTVDEEVMTGGAGGRVVVVVVFVLSESAETNDGEEKGELVEQTRRRHIKMIKTAIFAIIFLGE